MTRARMGRAGRLTRIVLVVATALTLSPMPAGAHDARPLSISIVEQAGHSYRVRVQVPESVEPSNQPSVQWPQGCQVRSDPGFSRGLASSSALIACTRPMEGQTIGFGYALFNPSLSTVVRFAPLDGAPRMAVLPPGESQWVVPSAPRRLDVARDYLVLGVGHILTGTDHLLFVAGLLLLARTGRRILVVITGFTLAHSVTLSLSALGLIRLPILPAEASIALSILFLAHQILRGRPDSLAVRHPVLVSSSFGLLHGLGFAAALAEIGLPQGEIVTSLLFFNVGVEVGQLLFVLPVLGLGWLVARPGIGQRYPWFTSALPALQTVAAYAIGIPASFWLFDRLARF